MYLRNLLFASILFVCVIPGLYAQVFIPDTIMRSWLNAEIPGIVDVNGIMDTAHADIPTVNVVDWRHGQGMPGMSIDIDVDLTGIQFLSSLEDLTLRGYAAQSYGFIANALPSSVRLIAVHLESVNTNSLRVDLPMLPNVMDSILIDPHIGSDSLTVMIAGVSDTLEWLQVQSPNDYSNILITNGGHVKKATFLSASNNPLTLDMAGVSVGRLDLGFLGISTHIENIDVIEGIGVFPSMERCH